MAGTGDGPFREAMKNSDINATWEYHDGTKHSLESLYANRHVLDWYNQPLAYKIYSSLDPIPLPGEFSPSAVSTLDAIADSGEASTDQRVPDLHTLARLCFFSNGVTKRLPYAGGQMEFRAAACTGALYHIELYLVCADLPELAAGVYHYCAHEHVLRRLRAGDFRAVLVEATGGEASIAGAPAVMICTSTFWRNAWKYQARAYRHCFWDNGTMLANLLAVAAAKELPARVVLGFADNAVNQLLDVNQQREAAISLVALGSGGDPPATAPSVTPLDLPTVPLSRTEVDYPTIRAMHAASSLESGDEAATWRGQIPERPFPPATGPLTPLNPLRFANLPKDPIETVIRRRGSTRRFARTPISLGQLSTILERAAGTFAADYLDPSGRPPNEVYLIANAIDGFGPGAYVLHLDKMAFELLRAGDFRAEAERLDLGQELAGDAAANVYFLVDLEAVLARFGNRGYRAAQLSAAIAGGRLYLAAYALRLGASGLTFFDDDVTAFFSPHAAGKSVMFLMALGQPFKARHR
jgi:SagB-type dehydrogenase family enzyme